MKIQVDSWRLEGTHNFLFRMKIGRPRDGNPSDDHEDQMQLPATALIVSTTCATLSSSAAAFVDATPAAIALFPTT
jgi:hypothetical protein